MHTSKLCLQLCVITFSKNTNEKKNTLRVIVASSLGAKLLNNLLLSTYFMSHVCTVNPLQCTWSSPGPA